MKSDMWAFLKLEPAKLRDFEWDNDAEKQPAPLKLAFPDLDEASIGADAWHGQEPAERIVNTILLCAVRDGASAISIEPETQSVRVRYIIGGKVREHLKLPSLALEPIVSRFKRLAQIQQGNGAAHLGFIRLRVDERFYELHVQTHPTQWGERVELHFSSVA
jgi:type IV pilus assembly protein PilB